MTEGPRSRRRWPAPPRPRATALIEMVAEADDALMEKFFEAGTLTQEELTAGLARAVRAARLFPVFCASGLRNIGIQPLADAIVDLRAVAGRTAVRGHRRRRAKPATRAADDKAPLRALGLEDRWPIRSRDASRCSASCPAC